MDASLSPPPLDRSLRVAIWMAQIGSADFREAAAEFLKRFKEDYPMLSEGLVRDIDSCLDALVGSRRGWARGELENLAAVIAMEKGGRLPPREEPVSW